MSDELTSVEALEQLKADLAAAATRYHGEHLPSPAVAFLVSQLVEAVVDPGSHKCSSCGLPEHMHGEGRDRYGEIKPDHMHHLFMTREELMWRVANNPTAWGILPSYAETLLANNQAIMEEDYTSGERLPSGATHVVKRSEDGQLSARRIRFIAF